MTLRGSQTSSTTDIPDGRAIQRPRRRDQAALDSINSPPADLVSLPDEQLQVAQEVRELIIDVIGETGGHFGANLGTCEFAVALHSLLESPRDKILWDAGQAYPHKVLTRAPRPARHDPPVQGLAPFCSVFESEHDIMGAGHASTSVGYGVGLKEAMRKGIGEDGKVVAVIGDGALHRRGRLRGAPPRRWPADADGDRPERQRDVDLAERARSPATSSASG